MTETVEEMVMSVNSVLDDMDLSKKVVREILKDFGGMQVYLPRHETAFKEEDYAEINEAFDGTNAKELVRKYSITFNTFYAIIRRKRAKVAEAHAKNVVRELRFDE